MKKKTITSVKKKAWAEFSRYIRLKHADSDGYEACYTCGHVKHWKEMQAGHGIAGRNNAVLFLEAVVKPQCAGCNIWGGGKYSIFTENLIGELGVDRYYEVVRESNRTLKYTIQDYEDVIENCKLKISQL